MQQKRTTKSKKVLTGILPFPTQFLHDGKSAHKESLIGNASLMHYPMKKIFYWKS